MFIDVFPKTIARSFDGLLTLLKDRVTYNALRGRSVKSAIFDAIDILVKSYCEVESYCVVVNLAFGRLLLISGSIFQLLVYQSLLFCFSFVPLLYISRLPCKCAPTYRKKSTKSQGYQCKNADLSCCDKCKCATKKGACKNKTKVVV